MDQEIVKITGKLTRVNTYLRMRSREPQEMSQYKLAYLYISYESPLKCRNVLIAAKGLEYARIGPLSSCVSLVECIRWL